MFTVRNKTAIVTGGARGIGFHCCRQLLLNGAKAVAILDLPDSDGKTAVESLNSEFGEKRAFFYPSDVTEFDKFEEVFKNATAALDGLDILINNAGIFNDRVWKKMINVNFSAVVNNTLVAYEYMGKQNGGKGGIIVNISSVAGLILSGSIPVYTGTKHAVLGFTCSLKDCYEKTGISVRVICPGLTETNLVEECKNSFLKFVDSDATFTHMQTERFRQPAEHVGKSVIEAIEKGENGSVWVTLMSEPPFEVELPKYESIISKVKGK